MSLTGFISKREFTIESDFSASVQRRLARSRLKHHLPTNNRHQVLGLENLRLRNLHDVGGEHSEIGQLTCGDAAF